MNDQTRVFVSTSLWNKSLSFPGLNRDNTEGKVKISPEEKSFNLQRAENLPKQEERTPGQPTRSVPDSIDSPKETREEGPYEEFIETDPNWSKEKSKGDNKDVNERTRTERREDN